MLVVTASVDVVVASVVVVIVGDPVIVELSTSGVIVDDDVVGVVGIVGVVLVVGSTSGHSQGAISGSLGAPIHSSHSVTSSQGLVGGSLYGVHSH